VATELTWQHQREEEANGARFNIANDMKILMPYLRIHLYSIPRGMYSCFSIYRTVSNRNAIHPKYSMIIMVS
jgi:hypothetical protein